MKSFFLFSLSSLISLALQAQEIDTAKLNAYFDTLEAHNQYMGSVALAKNGTVFYTKSIGWADQKRNLKADATTRYRIGSISKTFTAVLVFKAIEEGKLSLSQPLNTWFPQIRNAARITLAHLLSHRSGIHNFTDDEAYLTYNTKPHSQSQMLEIIQAGGSDFEPGSQSSYSNSNYVLLTYILESAYGLKYEKLLTSNILKPLMLRYTSVGGKINSKNNEAFSYEYLGDWSLSAETDMSVPAGAGFISSTPSDLVKFNAALLFNQLVSDSSLAQMKTLTDGFGMGLFTFPFFEHTYYGHTGGIDGFGSIFGGCFDDSISLAMTGNGLRYNTNDIAVVLLKATYGMPFDIPVFTEITFTENELDAFTGTYSSSQLPLKITITRENLSLMAQATGQPAFPLDPVSKTEFKFDSAGLKMLFDSGENTMRLIQGGVTYSFRKD